MDKWKSPSRRYRHDKEALRITCLKNVKFSVIQTRTDCQYLGYLYYSENLNWAAQNLRMGRMPPAGWTQLG